MKTSIIFLSVLCTITGCNENKQQQKQIEVVLPRDSVGVTKIDSAVVKPDTINILETTRQVLSALKSHDYTAFAAFIHPEDGVFFSQYAYIDTSSREKESKLFFSRTKFIQALSSKNKKTLWVGFDPSDKPTHMSLQEYINRFVYDVDFLHAEKTSVNEFIGGGNSLNNLRQIYPDAPFTESYFSGFKKEYGGMDWRTVRLVFKKLEGKYYLIALVHDEWTI